MLPMLALAAAVAGNSAPTADPFPATDPPPELGPEDATPPPEPTFVEAHEPAPGAPPPPQVVIASTDPRELKHRLEWHEERDEKLARMTVGFGAATAVLAGLGGVLVATSTRADSPRAATGLVAVGGIMCSAAVITAIGTIISGAVLGNHRNHRGFFLR